MTSYNMADVNGVYNFKILIPERNWEDLLPTTPASFIKWFIGFEVNLSFLCADC